jgi:hypothetical protein
MRARTDFRARRRRLAAGKAFYRQVDADHRVRQLLTSIARYTGPGDESQYSNTWSASLFIKCGEGFVNTFSIRDQFDWLLEGTAPDIGVWLKADGRVQHYIDDNKEAGRAILLETQVFVITLGLAEVAYSKETGRVMWAGVPRSQWDENRYGFRVTTVAENVANIKRIVELIRKHRGNAPIILTLSPVPLNATFRPVSCITANSVSKAILRVAIDEVMGDATADANLFYWPSYEIVTGYLEKAHSADRLHPSEQAEEAIMRAFFRAYCIE